MNLATRFPFSLSSLISSVVLGSVAHFAIAQPSSAITPTPVNFSSFNEVGDADTAISQASLSNNGLHNDDLGPDSNFNFSGSPAVDETTLTNFLNGVNSGDLDGPNPFFDTAFEGSAIQNSFNVQAGDTLSFDWKFLTNESPTAFGGISDYAFTAVDGNLNQVFEVNAGASQLSASSSNYTSEASGTFSTTFNSSQSNLDVAVGVVDIGDENVSSALQVSNGQIQPVPFGVSNEIGVLVALGGMSLLAWRRHRRRLQASQNS